MLSIYKASAGSGKTWRLSLEYLKLLLKQPDAYKHILAVTFTNKATTEMKERIIYKLSLLAKSNEWQALDGASTSEKSSASNETATSRKWSIADQKEFYSTQEALCKELYINGHPITPEEIQQRADSALTKLLHDYTHFRVETIDSFFQSVLRNLARELGLGAAYDIELDGSEVLEKAVDTMIEDADKEPAVLDWMERYIEEELREGRDRSIDKALKNFGKNIFKEYFQTKESLLTEKLKDKKFLTEYKKKLNAIKEDASQRIVDETKRFFDIIEENGWSSSDFSNGERGVFGYFSKLKNRDFSPDNYQGSRVQDALSYPEKWVKNTHPDRKHIIQLATDKLIPLLQKCEQTRERNYKDIVSAEQTLVHLYKVGLLTDISQKVRSINREENRFLLGDTAFLLHALIGQSDSPFIFEKIGTELHHTMIDEFQDTSHLQWENFKPLLLEGLSNGYNSLVVGDEKQSIYRFRNGDWRILNGLDNEMKAEMVETSTKNLPNNFRSETAIVQFNNQLFHDGIQILCKTFQNEIGENRCEEMRKAYSGIKQIPTKTGDKGYIQIRFFEKKPKSKKDNNETDTQEDDYDLLTLKQLVEDVENLQKEGISPNQIAILVRKNNNIPAIAEYFSNHRAEHPELPYCYNIVSDEAFQLKSSTSVRLMIAAMRISANHEDKIAQEEIRQHYSDQSLSKDIIDQLVNLSQLPLMELVERLYDVLPLKEIPQQESYLFAFMDYLNDFTATTSSDINEFLAYWEEKLCTRTIPTGTQLNGIRILSIHKSKGLQYHTVMVPFCDWSLSSEITQQIWCEAQEAPYNELALIPVNYTKDLKYSVFQKAYQDEFLQLLIENLNLMYVAFTRAEKNLMIYSKLPGEKITHVNELLYEAVCHNEHFDDTKKCLRIGQLYHENEKKTATEEHQSIRIPFISSKHKAGFRQSNRSRNFIHDKESEAYTNDFIEYGKLMHQIFSLIKHQEDVETAVRSMVNEGCLKADEEAETLDFIRQALTHPQASAWYTGDYKLYNECVILYRDEEGKIQEKRPDRVIQRGDKLQVIDFKFGEKLPKHHRQVREYMDLLRQMGYQEVEGYLWYVTKAEIESVTGES